jgi:hypothetical protein
MELSLHEKRKKKGQCHPINLSGFIRCYEFSRPRVHNVRTRTKGDEFHRFSRPAAVGYVVMIFITMNN